MGCLPSLLPRLLRSCELIVRESLLTSLRDQLKTNTPYTRMHDLVHVPSITDSSLTFHLSFSPASPSVHQHRCCCPESLGLGFFLTLLSIVPTTHIPVFPMSVRTHLPPPALRPGGFVLETFSAGGAHSQGEQTRSESTRELRLSRKPKEAPPLRVSGVF